MKRIKKIFILLFFILLFMPLTTAKAYNDATCADVIEAVDELESIDAMYDELKCDSAVSSATIYKCNDLRIKRAAVLEDIFEYDAEKVCPSIDLSEIINKYSDECSNEFSSEIKGYSDKVMKFFFMAAPFLILILGSLDFFKIIVATDPREIKKNRSNFIKRVVAFILLYFTPFIVQFLFSLTPYNINGNNFVCAQELVFSSKTTTTEISGIYGGNNYGGNGQKIADAAKELIEYAHDNGFTYNCPGFTTFTAFSNANTGKIICCATLASNAIYKAAPDDGFGLAAGFKKSKCSIDSAPGLAMTLDAMGWELITDKSELEPGDIVFFKRDCCTLVSVRGRPAIYPGHVEVYAGDGKTYSAGKTQNIIDEIDYLDRDVFAFAFRVPSK